MLTNFGIGQLLIQREKAWCGVPSLRKLLLVVGLCFNIGLLGYYKYANFFIETLNWALNSNFVLERILLPLAISFFTFEQISYVVDAYRGEAKHYTFDQYSFFVLFFPRLIAGPIIRHNELIPQLNDNTARFSPENFALGLFIFVVGLFKKVVIADNVGLVSSPIYDGLALGHAPDLMHAWLGTLGYSLQLYFDFSGYSDMAIGISRLFNIVLPANFDSPYKASSPVDFWRRWHMTLSRFLRDYLYVPLGGNRGGGSRRYTNLMIVMLLGGLWHGAGWGFVIWGGLNGIYLLANHGYCYLRGRRPLSGNRAAWPIHYSCIVVTLVFIMLSRVFFRSADLPASLLMLQGLFGFHGLGSSEDMAAMASKFLAFIGLYAFCILVPNLQQILADKQPVLQSVRPVMSWSLRFTPWAAIILALVTIATVLEISGLSEFLYFQF